MARSPFRIPGNKTTDMNNKIKELAELLRKFRIQKVSPSSISAEDMPFILEDLQDIKEWIEMVQGEAIHRLSEGETIKGYTIHYRQYRQIADTQGALDALKAYNPEAAAECIQEKLAGISRIKQVIGKKAFEDVLGQYTATRTTHSLMKIPNDLSIKTY